MDYEGRIKVMDSILEKAKQEDDGEACMQYATAANVVFGIAAQAKQFEVQNALNRSNAATQGLIGKVP